MVRRGGAWIIAAKITGLVSTLLGNIILTRLLTPQFLGIYYLLFSLVNLGNFVAPLGLNRAVVKFLAESLALQDIQRAKEILRKVLFMGDMGALFFSLGLLIFRYTAMGDVILSSIPKGRIIILGTISAFFMSTSTLRGEAFLGMKNYRDAVLHRTMLQNLLFVTGITALWLTYKAVDLETVVLVLLISTLLDYILASYKIWHWNANIGSDVYLNSKSDLPMPTWRLIGNISLPLWMVTILNFVISQFPLWYLDWWQVTRDVALFGIALKVNRILFRFPSTLVNSILPPVIAGEYAAGNKHKLERVVRLGASLAFGVTLLLLIFFLLFGQHFLVWAFGAFYGQAYVLALILAVGELINAWMGAATQVLMMGIHQRALMWMNIIATMVALSIGIIGVQRGGVQGVAWAASISLGVLNLLMGMFLYFHEGIKSYAYFLPSIIQQRGG